MDGFFMPGEFEPHRGCILIWPFRPGSWNYGAEPAREAFRQVIWAIARSEKVWVAAGKGLPGFGPGGCCLRRGRPWASPGRYWSGIEIFEAETDDSWPGMWPYLFEKWGGSGALRQLGV